MDSKPYDSKKSAALLAAAKDFLGFPVTSIILRAEDGGCQIRWSSGSAPTITETLAWGRGHPLQRISVLSWPDTEPNKNC